MIPTVLYWWRLIRTWFEWSGLRGFPRADKNSPLALVASLSDWEYGCKVESMLALGLAGENWRVRFLIRNPTLRNARRWFKCAGFRDLSEFSSYESWLGDEKAAVYSAEVKAQGTSFQQVKEWTFRNCLIGPQILASISRKMFSAGFDVNDPEVAGRVDAQLVTAIHNVLAAERVLDALQPSLLLVNEANYTYFACLVDVAIARGIRVVQFIQPSREDAIIFWKLDQSTRRTHPAAVSAATLGRLESWNDPTVLEDQVFKIFGERYGGKWYLQSRNQIGASKKSRGQVVRQLEIESGLPIVVVFSSVLWDANLFYGRDLFQDNGEWFKATLKAAAANPNVSWLIKLHPVNNWKRELEGIHGEMAEMRLVREAVGVLPPHVKLLLPDCGISTLSLFEIADFGVTIRGTAGMEMPCFGKPVITAGTGRYSGLGFTLDSKTKEDYLTLLARLPSIPPLTPHEIALAKKHFFAAFRLRPWELQSFKATMRPPKGPGDLDYARLSPVVRTWNDLQKQGDLSRFARWATVGKSPDYMEESKLP